MRSRIIRRIIRRRNKIKEKNKYITLSLKPREEFLEKHNQEKEDLKHKQKHK
jgi:hypothetical protein